MPIAFAMRNGRAPEIIEIDAETTLSSERLDQIPLVGFNLSGTRPPLFVVRTWSEEVGNYQRLATHLGPDQPLYTVSPPAGEVASDFPGGTDEWADLCIERFGSLLERKQIALTGWSYAGVVALRVAERLAERGVDVRLVALVDSTLPRRKPKGDSRKRSEPHHFFVMVERLFELEDRQARRLYFDRYRNKLARRTHKRIRKRRKQLKRSLRALFGRSESQPKASAPRPAGEADESKSLSVRDTKTRARRSPLLMRAIRIAYLKHQARVTALPVALFWTEESRERVGDASLGWTLVLRGDYRSCPVPGTHHDLYEEPHVATLARRLSSALAEAWGSDAPAKPKRPSTRVRPGRPRDDSPWATPG